LDETKAVGQELDQEKIKNEIEELKDMYETAGEITDQLWKTIDELTKEIKELKSARASQPELPPSMHAIKGAILV